MQYSDTTNKDGIIQQIEFRTNIGDAGISGDPTLLKQITGQVNDFYMKATGLLISADGQWKWDDSNHTNQPVATTDLVADQTDYTVIAKLPSVAQDWLQVERVNIKDASGSFYTLFPKDRSKFSTPRTERETVSGQPSSFDFDGASIFLDAKPNYSSTGGLEIVFARAPLLFASDDTTKKPGFASVYHEYLVLGPTYIWEKYKSVGNPEQTKRDMAEMEQKMSMHYANRNQYEINKLARPYKSYK